MLQTWRAISIHFTVFKRIFKFPFHIIHLNNLQLRSFTTLDYQENVPSPTNPALPLFHLVWSSTNTVLPPRPLSLENLAQASLLLHMFKTSSHSEISGRQQLGLLEHVHEQVKLDAPNLLWFRTFLSLILGNQTRIASSSCILQNSGRLQNHLQCAKGGAISYLWYPSITLWYKCTISCVTPVTK